MIFILFPVDMRGEGRERGDIQVDKKSNVDYNVKRHRNFRSTSFIWPNL